MDWSAAQLCAWEEGARRSVFLSRQWYENLVETVPDLAACPVWMAHTGAGRSWLLPLAASGPLEEAREVSSLTNYYTGLYGFSGPPDAAGIRDAAAGFVAQLAAEAPRAAVVRLSPFDESYPELTAMERQLREGGYWTQRFVAHANWYLPAERLSYRAYLEARPSRLRNTIERRRKRFDREKGARIEIATGEGEMEQAIAAYNRVYARSWKQPEPYERFIPGLLRSFARAGWVRVGIAWLGDLPIAAQIWTVSNGYACIYKLSYDGAYGRFSPGTVLTAAMFEHVLDEDRAGCIDYLMGDDAYKRDWMSRRRQRYGIVAFNPRTLRGLARGAVNITGRPVRQGLRRIRRRPNPR